MTHDVYITGNSSFTDYGITWVNPPLMLGYNFETLPNPSPTLNSYSYHAALGETRLYEPNSPMNKPFIPAPPASLSLAGTPWARSNGDTDYRATFGRVEMDSTMEAKFFVKPSIYYCGSAVHNSGRFYSMPATVPDNWIVETSPNMYGQKRISAVGPRQLFKPALSVFSEWQVFHSFTDKGWYLGQVDQMTFGTATLFGLPSSFIADDSATAFSAGVTTYEYAFRWYKVTATGGVVFTDRTIFASGIAETSWSPNRSRLQATVTVGVVSVPDDAFAYYVEKRATVDLVVGNWALSTNDMGRATSFGNFDVCDPKTGAWMPCALFKIPD